MAGTMRERSPGVWELRAALGRDPVTGKYRQISRTFHGGERAAGRALAALVTEHTSTSAPGGGSDTTLAHLLDRWWEQLEYEQRSPLTLAGYRWRIEKILKPALGATPLRKIDPADIDRLYRELTKRGQAPRTIRQTHAILHRALGQAVRWGWLTANPADRATPPTVDHADVTVPDADDIAKLLAAADPVMTVFLRLAAATGARRGELCALRWSDFRAGVVTISRSIVAVTSSQVLVKATKTRGTRHIPLDPVTIDLVDTHLAAMTARARAASAELDPAGYVFGHPDDVTGTRPWHPDRVTRRFEQLRRTAGIEGVRLHDVRHWVATHLIASGMDVRAVADRLGHSSPRMTLDVYAAAVSTRGIEAADILGRALPAG